MSLKGFHSFTFSLQLGDRDDAVLLRTKGGGCREVKSPPIELIRGGQNLDPGGLIASPCSPPPSPASPIYSKPLFLLSSCLDNSHGTLNSRVVYVGHKGAEMPISGPVQAGDASNG